MKDMKVFINGLKELELELSEDQIQQFYDYYELLVEWNKVMNLTAITEFEDVLKKHFVDSLSLVKVIKLEGQLKVIDLGTGAGFPGIPLKIAFPELEIVLLDSLNKRIKFLNEVIEKLGLKNISAYHGRAEDFGVNKLYRGSFDLCVSRAVANLSTLSEYCMPFVKIGGSFISYKSGKIEEELESSVKAIKLFGGKLNQVSSFTLPESDIDRTLVVIDKVKETPNAYPRTAGKPAKEPIM